MPYIYRVTWRKPYTPIDKYKWHILQFEIFCGWKCFTEKSRWWNKYEKIVHLVRIEMNGGSAIYPITLCN